MPATSRSRKTLRNVRIPAIAASRPVFLVVNHLSYVDANVLDALLVSSGQRAVADRMTVLVGPKVYMHPVRRLASLCFGAIKIPQSLVDPVRTLTATIAAELGEAVKGDTHYQVLFLIGLVLFAITFLVNVAADLAIKGVRRDTTA